MKDGKYELKDLTAKDEVLVIAALLYGKGIFTPEEYVTYRKEFLNIKNARLEEELKEKSKQAYSETIEE